MGGLQRHSTTLTYEFMPPSPVGGQRRGGPSPPYLPSLCVIFSTLAGFPTTSFPYLGLSSGLYGALSAPPPSCRLGDTSTRKSTFSTAIIWGEAWAYLDLRPRNTGPPGFVSTGGTKGTTGSDLGGKNATIGGCSGGNLELYNGQSCDRGIG